MFLSVEYKYIWKVQNKLNDDKELKPHFYYSKHEIEVNNQVFQDFLHEAAVMKKFHHPNVLSVFGVSMDGNTPCIILPLMKNGDLKDYLTHNMTVSDFLYYTIFFRHHVVL